MGVARVVMALAATVVMALAATAVMAPTARTLCYWSHSLKS